ncbi:hypothetical protein DRQ32_06735, partial [bacterium]
MVRLFAAVALCVLFALPADAWAQVTPMESLQREAVQQASPEDNPVKAASPMFANFGIGRVGEA